jgi:hypothetical protein
MMEKCYDEAVLQAFLDNELEQSLSQKVARHLVDCDPCAILLAEVEEETAFAFAALEQEFNTLVPTQRLWTKINESIETQSRQRTVWQRLLTLVSGISFSNPQVVAFGSLLLIVGVVSTLIVIKSDDAPGGMVAQKSPAQTVPPVQIARNEPTPIVAPPSSAPPVENDRAIDAEPKFKAPAPQYQIERAAYVEPSRKPSTPTAKTSSGVKPAAPQYLDGEENFVSTISQLEKTVESKKDVVLNPSARFAYEKDLALVDDTIKKMQKEVKKNPKNADAKQILFVSYQNKIELLNSVTQRSELMATLRD